MLRVYVHQSVAEFFEHRQRHRGVVDEGPTLTGTGQFPSDDAVVCIVFYIVLVEKGFHVVTCQVEVGLDDTFLRTSLDGLRIGALS